MTVIAHHSQMEHDGQQHSLPLNIEVITLINDQDVGEIPIEVSDFAPPLSILNGPCQATLLALLAMLSITANACVIANIRHNCIKLRSNHFLLIQHLCLADLIGATLILPAPLVTSLRGRWEGGAKLCHLSSVINVALWLQHVFMFVMLKVRTIHILSDRYLLVSNWRTVRSFKKSILMKKKLDGRKIKLIIILMVKIIKWRCILFLLLCLRVSVCARVWWNVVPDLMWKGIDQVDAFGDIGAATHQSID